MPVIPEYWQSAKDYLRTADSVIADLIERFEEPPLSSKEELFETLIHSIVGQQISAIAADAIWGRLGKLVELVVPDSFAAVKDQQLCGRGITRVRYNPAFADETDEMSGDSYESLQGEEVKFDSVKNHEIID